MFFLFEYAPKLILWAKVIGVNPLGNFSILKLNCVFVLVAPEARSHISIKIALTTEPSLTSAAFEVAGATTLFTASILKIAPEATVELL